MIVYVRASNIYDDSRATKEIKSLDKAGHEVMVLGWNRNGKATKETNKVFADTNVKIRLFDCTLSGGIGIKNIDKLFKFSIWIKKQLESINNIDVVHACDFDTGYICYKYCKKNGIKLIYDIFDYYIDSHNIPYGLSKIIEKQEIKVINYACVTILCTEERKRQISKSQPRKIVVLHNSPDLPSLDTKVDIEYDYVYCGALIERRLIREVAQEYSTNKKLEVLFAGDGYLREVIENVAEQNDGFYYIGPISYSEVLEYEKRALVLSAIYEPTVRNHQLCAPNKFYEAMALSKPVIVCKGTGIDDIVVKNKIGLVIDYDVRQFFKAIEWIKSNQKEATLMGQRARILYEKSYSWNKMETILVDTYADILEKI